MSKPKIYAMIPARYGSTRLKMKNLALINGKPMISYAINAAKESRIFDEIFVNSEHDIFSDIAKRYSVDFYKRPSALATSEAKSDSVVADFIEEYPDADLIVWVNPISPFQSGEEIASVVQYFIDEELDSLVTVENKQVHCMYNGGPVNFNPNEVFAQTQDLISVQPFVYSIMMWRSNSFLNTFKEKGHALLSGKFGVYPVNKLTGIIIKTQEDLMIADLLMSSLQEVKGVYKHEYDSLVS